MGRAVVACGRSDYSESDRTSLSGPADLRRTSAHLGRIGLWPCVILQCSKSGLIFGHHAIEQGRSPLRGIRVQHDTVRHLNLHICLSLLPHNIDAKGQHDFLASRRHGAHVGVGTLKIGQVELDRRSRIGGLAWL